MEFDLNNESINIYHRVFGLMRLFAGAGASEPDPGRGEDEI